MSRRWTAFASSSSRPPGSAASVTFGTGLTTTAPGSAEGGLIVSDIEAARDELTGRGINASAIWHGPPFRVEARQPGPDPERSSYVSFFSFTDPDGNTWLVQEVTTRLPGRIDPADTAFASMADLASALVRAEAAHGEHQKRAGRSHLSPPVRPRRELACVVCRLHGGRAGRDGPASVTETRLPVLLRPCRTGRWPRSWPPSADQRLIRCQAPHAASGSSSALTSCQPLRASTAASWAQARTSVTQTISICSPRRVKAMRA
jgi:hypothetical protein